VGIHGLPLIGSGDWNDGMNRVGREGKGESVWLGWFLHTNLVAWAKIAETRGELERARVWREHAAALQISLETHAWDGEWYKRAFYDDGTPLGLAQNDDCQIDAIAQSWAVISGAADPARAKQAMNSHVLEKLPDHLQIPLLELCDPCRKPPKSRQRRGIPRAGWGAGTRLERSALG
jgi:cyclic beta-1,2-glucan synthetase